MATVHQMRLLHVSDVHGAVDNVKLLNKFLKETKQTKIDAVLLSGDLANMPMEVGADSSTPDEVFKQYEREFDEVLKAVETLGSRVYYIPGNHDPPSTYPPQSSSTSSVNVHNQLVSIAPRLYLVGLGGSIPGYVDGKHFWDGYPYTSEDDIKEVLQRLFEPLIADSSPLSDGNQLVVMTHVGPTESSTTIYRSYPDHLHSPVVSGSPSLLEWLCKPKLQDSVLMNVHGHTHASYGQTHLGNVTVLNSGPLLDGRFAIYTLSSRSDGKWSLSGVEHYLL